MGDDNEKLRARNSILELEIKALKEGFTNRKVMKKGKRIALKDQLVMTVDELILQGAGRDLRPDVVTPAPDAPVGVDLDKVRAAAEEEYAVAKESFVPSPDVVAATDETKEEEKP